MNKKLLLTIFVLMFSLSFASAALADNLIGYWDLNSTAGNEVDKIGYIGNWTSFVNNVDRGEPGIIENAFKFDAANSYASGVSHNLAANPDASISFSLWVKPLDHPSQEGRILNNIVSGSESQFSIQVTTANQIKFDASNETADRTVSSGVVFEEDEWVHIVAIAGDDELKIYLNGTLVATETNYGKLGFTNAAWRLGSQADSGIKEYNGTVDEIGVWNRTLLPEEISLLYNSGNGRTYPFGDLSVSLLSPTDASEIITNPVNFNASLDPGVETMVNATLWIYNLTGASVDNGRTNSVTGTSVNYTNFTVDLEQGSYAWNLLLCADTGNCTFALNNNSFIWGIANTSAEYNLTVYETQLRYYNVTFNVGSGTPTGVLWRDGTSYESTVVSLGGSEYRLENEVQTPTSLGTKNLFWEITLGSLIYNTTTQTQEVEGINLSICGAAPQDTVYLNFTFKNETLNLEDTTGIIGADFVYGLSTLGNINKTLNYINTGEELSYAFCFTPEDQTLIVDSEVVYSNAESQQRNFNALYTLTNTGFTQVLYLLPTSLGIFQTFVTQTLIGNTIDFVDATVTRTIGATTITVANGLTDSSGLVTFFLNPDASYMATFSKSGYLDNTFTFTPSSEVRTVVIGTDTSEISNGTTISLNTSYGITPVNSTLVNNTNYDFSFTITGNPDINKITMNITNMTGGQIHYEEQNGQGTITESINTGNLTGMIGVFTYQTNQETIQITRFWQVGDNFIGEYSLFRQMKLWDNYGFTDFIRLLIVLLIIIGIMIYMSTNEITDSTEIKAVTIMLLVWGFSLVGWLDNPIIAESAGIGRYGKQYGIAILTTGMTTFFLLRRLLR